MSDLTPTLSVFKLLYVWAWDAARPLHAWRMEFTFTYVDQWYWTWQAYHRVPFSMSYRRQ